MLTFIVALAIPVAGLAALAAIAFTIISQAPSVRRLLADARAMQRDPLQRDREFLAVLIATPRPLGQSDMVAQPALSSAVVMPVSRRVVRPAAPLWPAHLRAAA